MPANLSRPDVDQALGMGANHGYQRDIPITAPGTYKLCVYAIGQYGNHRDRLQAAELRRRRPPPLAASMTHP